jgi:alpha-galactosidase
VHCRHVDTFRLIGKKGVALTSPSLSTAYPRTNPTVRYWRHELLPTGSEDDGAVVNDYDQYVMDLLKSNAAHQPYFNHTYSFRSEYGLPDLSRSSFETLLSRFNQESARSGDGGWICRSHPSTTIYVPGRSISTADPGFKATKQNCSQSCDGTAGCHFFQWGHTAPDFQAPNGWCYLLEKCGALKMDGATPEYHPKYSVWPQGSSGSASAAMHPPSNGTESSYARERRFFLSSTATSIQPPCDKWCQMQDLCDKQRSGSVTTDQCFTQCIEDNGRALATSTDGTEDSDVRTGGTVPSKTDDVEKIGQHPNSVMNPADNGIGRRPPMGWSSWTSAWMNPNQTYMVQTMDALALPRGNSGQKKKKSLAQLGYTQVGLDDFWQACGAGVNGSFHDIDGNPLVNETRFPNMTAMTEHGHRLGMRVGWYMNNCGCAEHTWEGASNIQRHFDGDVRALKDYKFDGAKFDACGQFENLTVWADLINASGRPMMIENCHWGGDAPYVLDDTTGELWCPYNIYRAGMDVAPHSWQSFMNNLDSITRQLNKQTFAPAGPGNWPHSKPGCWAYFDSVQTGNGWELLEEDRTNFGALCITSSPLILGMDLTKSAMVDRVWEILSNEEAIAVSLQWAGHPGRMVKQLSKQLPIQYPHALPCDDGGSSPDDNTGGGGGSDAWELGPVVANKTRYIKSKTAQLCVDAWMKNPLTMEPCTGNASQQFTFDEATGEIQAPNFPANSGQLNGCFDIMGKVGPAMQLTQCYGQPNDKYLFNEAGGEWTGNNVDSGIFPKRCIRVEHGQAIEGLLYAKPQPHGSMAVFAFNAGVRDTQGKLNKAGTVNMSVDLAKDLLLPPSSYHVRDIWNRKDLGTVGTTFVAGEIGYHDSVFVLLTPVRQA